MELKLLFIVSSLLLTVSSKTLSGKFIMKLNNDAKGGFDIQFVDVEKFDNTGDDGAFNGKVDSLHRDCDIINFDFRCTNQFNVH